MCCVSSWQREVYFRDEALACPGTPNYEEFHQYDRALSFCHFYLPFLASICHITTLRYLSLLLTRLK